ncbi:cytoplasmic axial filament protein CafA and Ribonuclease G [Porphyromonas crevioricanis JCM 15906]|uniref:Ribonuclease G n=2 Tax=Porphyromonas crevioricanis TaxID=393921 RepID=A0A2X4PI28_9PORP|nr:cytoplasmic axial filament protein CafA and Ribonuclease G [Porphyromonas crevioricanis JCM 15906]SJZ94382.1 ribonuclease G [Porphyromonas crevioricanis]SQH73614.1 Ribonuclease G [Porphyromonas crevioricanis]
MFCLCCFSLFRASPVFVERVLRPESEEDIKKFHSEKVNSELIVDVDAKKVSIAVLEDGKLVELQREPRDQSFAVGDIYLGKVKKIMPGLNAAFVDVGYKKDAFLHYFDLGLTYLSQRKMLESMSQQKGLPQVSKMTLEADLPKEGKIGEILKAGQQILVQIVKEPISTKGPRLTTEISLAGRSLVLVPFSDRVSVSQKIKSGEERARLRQLMLSIKPHNFSVIIRTSAAGKKASELDAELKMLLKRFTDSVAKIPKVSKIPQILYEEAGRTLGLLRDTFNPDTFQNIHVNNKFFYDSIRDYISLISPGSEDIVHHYVGELPIFDNFAVTKQIKALFGRTVTYKSGAYLIIEQTEAMHVVDVNSGNRARGSNQQEDTAVDVNMAAAEELARQLRLRDMGGIIVVDFIDMAEAQHRQQLYEHMCKLMSTDRAKHNILPLSKFGLMQITRQRVRPAMSIDTEEKCPTCLGSGKMKASILFTDTLEEKVRILVDTHGLRQFVLHVHPYVAAYLKKGIVSIAMRWKMKYAKGIRVIPDQSVPFLNYRFFDNEGNELEDLDGI